MLHLIHPAMVHFSVAFLVLGGSCEAWGLLARRQGPTEFGGTMVVIGVLTLPVTLVSGYLAANTVDVSDTSVRLIAAHELNAWLVATVFVAAIFWKAWHRGKIPLGQRAPYALLLIASVVLTIYSALLGGEMVYLHGVGVKSN